MPRHAAARFASTAAAVLAAGAFAAPALAQNHVVMNKTLVSSSAHKECVNLSDQQVVRYWYRAEAPIDFNVQYVENKTTVYPVKRDRQAIGSGSYTPKAAQQVTCMVWTNTGRQPVLFRVEYARMSR
jgi:hypothetical protein